MELELLRRSHSVGKNTWHIEWCTKYRYEMMRKEENRNLVAACIRQAAHRHGIKLRILEVLPEHVHTVVELPHGMAATKAVNLLKGYSSWKIFQVKEHFGLRYPKRHFWSRGYMTRTVGVDEEVAIGYVESQLEHHGVVFM
jgi:putative transposase